MATGTSFNLTEEELMKYKPLNLDVHPNLSHLAGNINIRNNRGGKPRNNNWRPPEQKVKTNWILNDKNNQNEDEKLYSATRGILNKLSDSNFNELVEEIINLKIKKSEHLSNLIELIFKKAIVEIKFNSIYGKLCYEL